MIEVILAVALFATFSFGAIAMVTQGLVANRIAQEELVANQFASEGLEAVRSIKNQDYALVSAKAGQTSGIAKSGTSWVFSGTDNTLIHNANDNYTRVISISAVTRDGSGNIVPSGTLDSNTLKVTSTVSWDSTNGAQSVVLSTYLTNWRLAMIPPIVEKNGMLIFGDSPVDTIKYSLLDTTTDPVNWNWSSPQSAADIDAATTNKAVRAAKLYASTTRNEKILISRHYNGTAQFIYAQVWNGSSWGNIQLLSNWNTTNFLDVQNFDGSYLSNGDFMVAYSDNTAIPKFRIWNGSAWSAGANMQSVAAVPNYISLKCRPATNEVMAAISNQSLGASTQYFNGGSYTQANWGSYVSVTTKGTNTYKLIDFDWNQQTPTKGTAVYVAPNNGKILTAKVWTANGSGSGGWSSTTTSTLATGIGGVQIKSQPGSNYAIASVKDGGRARRGIRTLRIDLTPAFAAPANSILSTATDTGIQRSYDIGFAKSGALGIAFYSDGANLTPQFKLFNPSTNSFDVNSVTLSFGSYTPGSFNTFRVIPSKQSDDMMILMADSNLDIYSVYFDSNGKNVYTSPATKAFKQQGVNGSATTDFWYDFVWDN